MFALISLEVTQVFIIQKILHRLFLLSFLQRFFYGFLQNFFQGFPWELLQGLFNELQQGFFLKILPRTLHGAFWVEIFKAVLVNHPLEDLSLTVSSDFFRRCYLDCHGSCSMFSKSSTNFCWDSFSSSHFSESCLLDLLYRSIQHFLLQKLSEDFSNASFKCNP